MSISVTDPPAKRPSTSANLPGTHGYERSICSKSLRDGAPFQTRTDAHSMCQQTSMGDHDAIVDAKAVFEARSRCEKRPARPDVGGLSSASDDSQAGRNVTCAALVLPKFPTRSTHRSSVAKTLPPRSEAIMPIISCNLALHPTPPTMSTSLLPT